MDTLDGSSWDVLIAGTGIQQSLLALALSRSGKKVLHLDSNDYYGGPEAALSTQEAEIWAQKVKQDSRSPFHDVSITKILQHPDSADRSKIAPSRAYNLSLAPSIIYTRSGLLPALVSSRIHQQLEFLAVGSWFVFEQPEADLIGSSGRLRRVPNSREDIFADTSLNLRTKGALVKFLRFVGNYEEKTEMWHPYRDTPFPLFLSRQFNVVPVLHGPFLALTMSALPAEQTSTEYALSQIARHLRSIGLFGPGFAAVIPKWGGLSEVAQVACRSGAVGGAVYVLNKSIEAVKAVQISEPASEGQGMAWKVHLGDDESVTVDEIVGTDDQVLDNSLWTDEAGGPARQPSLMSRTVSIVNSPLTSLFPATSEGGPSPAGAIVVIHPRDPTPPIHIVAHSGDTGECPVGQTIIYSSIALPSEQAYSLLDQAVEQLLASIDESPAPLALFTIRYQQQVSASVPTKSQAGGAHATPRAIRFPDTTSSNVFDETILAAVKDAWTKIMGQDTGDFLQFQERDDTGEEDEDMDD